MSDPLAIRLLETDNNRRGDLFGELIAGLFVALGYGRPRLNIHKSGREIDISAIHRLEARRAVGECKATIDKIGGDDINKFIGALDAERSSKDHRPIIGYFVSLSGFKETAIEQEQNRQTKIVMLDGSDVVHELIEGRLLIRREAATELAGRCCTQEKSLVLDTTVELLAHKRGWIWAIYYTQGKERTHFALIHSDGTPLARALANEVIASDAACGGVLEKFSCLNPSPSSTAAPLIPSALAAYHRYLAEECGFIQLDGMPADTDIGSHRLRLESLFVPLNVDVTIAGKRWQRQAVGGVLAEHPRLALLAPPGAGKSTLLKRLASAYSDSKRRKQIHDDLPERDWLPLFFRCRELRDLARGSFGEILDALAEREPIRAYGAAFRAHIDRSLLEGRVLLLVDGLDEIPNPADRAAFVATLRSALQAYPDIAAVLTSREAGYRHVAAHLAGICTEATLSAFDATDIERLCLGWYQEVFGHADKPRADARQLAADIIANDRIEQLAVNPLLLTTLLLVKRWLGSLPTRRTVLYNKAVEVLLMTWNTEGHDPIPEDEALPQLCYVASAMMMQGLQKISRSKLAILLQDARVALPTELGYVKGTVEAFIQRVEERSSLLTMTGLDIEDGLLVEFFEFRHLTFQEFLSARAMVEGWHPGRRDNDTLLSVLATHIDDEKWREVIPLAASLGGKNTEPLIKELTERVAKLPSENLAANRNVPTFLALASCLADEASARPDSIRTAIHQLVRLGFAFHDDSNDRMLARGRYGQEFREQARAALALAPPNLVNARYALLSAAWWQTLNESTAIAYLDAAAKFSDWIRSAECIVRCEGALGQVGLCFEHRANSKHPAWAATSRHIHRMTEGLAKSLVSDVAAEQHVACWALALLAGYLRIIPPAQPDVLGTLFRIWHSNNDQEMRRLAAWAIAAFPLGNREELGRCSSISRREFKKFTDSYDQLSENTEDSEKIAALKIGWYLRSPWTDFAIKARARDMLGPIAEGPGKRIVDPERASVQEWLDHIGSQRFS